MKLTFGFLTIFALLMVALQLSGGGGPAEPAFAGEGSFTSSPSEGPISCGEEVPDEGDDNTGGDDDDDDGNQDDPEDGGGDDFQDDTSSAGDDENIVRDWDGSDPNTELDDCWGPRYGPNDCGAMDLPGIYYFFGKNYEGECVYFGNNVCCLGDYGPYNDAFYSMKLVGYPAVQICYHYFYEGLCAVFTGDDPDFTDEGLADPFTQVSSHRFEFPNDTPTATPGCAAALLTCGEPDTGPAAAADANCDGGVDGSDALAVLSYASGAGAGCTGDSGSGDADCSGEVNTVDATRILLVAAGLESGDC